MYKERNFNFLQNWRRVEKPPRLNLYLPYKKCTMKNINFFQNKRFILKLSRVKLYLPQQKLTMKGALIFFEIRIVFKGSVGDENVQEQIGAADSSLLEILFSVDFSRAD